MVGRPGAPLFLWEVVMQKMLLTVDRVSTWFGKFTSWSVVLLTLLISWEVFSRVS